MIGWLSVRQDTFHVFVKYWQDLGVFTYPVGATYCLGSSQTGHEVRRARSVSEYCTPHVEQIRRSKADMMFSFFPLPLFSIEDDAGSDVVLVYVLISSPFNYCLRCATLQITSLVR